MVELGADALLLSVGSDLPYLTGYQAVANERLTMFVLTASEAVLVVPELEAPRVGDPAGFEVRAWAETEDPVAIVAAIGGAPGSVLIGSQTWSRFTLALESHLQGSRFSDAEPLMAGLRVVKDDAEAESLRTAGARADVVAGRLAAERFSGRAEIELSRHIFEMTLEAGHDFADFAIVASGPNGASPHHEPDDRVMGRGDTVVVDFGGRVDGYWSDTTRTFSIGNPADEVGEAYAVLEAAQDAAVRAVRPGVPAEEIDRVARTIISDAGCGDWFIHRTGHGIGMDVHEHPYLVAGNTDPLSAGMAFSIEPGIYPPNRWGMRIEDIVLVTEDGAERLNNSSRQLVVVD
jgi:D-alanyl-D-alanine dipeptidase